MGGGARVMTAVAILTIAAGALSAQEERIEWTGRMERGQTLEVRGISGDVRAVLASGPEARVVATKRGRERDFDAVSIEVVEHGGGVIVCVVYGLRERGGDPCDRRDRGDHGRHDHDHDIRVSVDYEVEVPADVAFEGRTVSGNVEALGLRSHVEATTVSGDVDVSTTGTAWGSTVSGSLDVEMGSNDWDDLHFSTVSGDITLTLPAGLDAEIDFESLSGDFSSDFEVSYETRRERWVGTRVRGTVGAGSRELSFNTVSGDVQLRRGRNR